MRHTEKIQKFSKWEALATYVILAVSAYDEVCNIRSMPGNHAYCQLLSCKNKEPGKIFLLFSLPPSFSYTHTSTPTHTCGCACMRARTHKKLLFQFPSPSFFVQLQIADVPNFREGFSFVCK